MHLPVYKYYTFLKAPYGNISLIRFEDCADYDRINCGSFED
jgi:hypothetical protein